MERTHNSVSRREVVFFGLSSSACPYSQERAFDEVSIVLVGKYTDLKDSYMSVTKSLEHSAFRCKRKLILKVCITFNSVIKFHNHLLVGRCIRFRTGDPSHKPGSVPRRLGCSRLCRVSLSSGGNAFELTSLCSGILVPGGFGVRGTEGMILAIKWAREQKCPFLGICLGFQLAVVEWARHVLGMKSKSASNSKLRFPHSIQPTCSLDATSAEFDPNTEEPAIIFMPEISKTHMGGTMRLGLRPTVFDPAADWSKLRKLYGGAAEIWERHRHRYEVNPALIEKFVASGLVFAGKDEKGERMQVLELPGMFHH